MENRAADSLARDHGWDLRANLIILRAIRAFDELQLNGMLADKEPNPIHPILSLMSAMHSVRRGTAGHNQRLASAIEELAKKHLISASEFEGSTPYDDHLLADIIATAESYLSAKEASGSREEILLKVLAYQVTNLREYLPDRGSPNIHVIPAILSLSDVERQKNSTPLGSLLSIT